MDDTYGGREKTIASLKEEVKAERAIPSRVADLREILMAPCVTPPVLFVARTCVNGGSAVLRIRPDDDALAGCPERRRDSSVRTAERGPRPATIAA
jgi:hypothetical protein